MSIRSKYPSLLEIISFMILLSLVVMVLMCSPAKAEEKPLEVRFGGGISRGLSQYALASHQAWDIVNFDIGRGIEKRKGYWAVGSSLYGDTDTIVRDSTLGLYGLRKRDGSQKLLRMAADSSNNWTDLWVGTLAAPQKVDAWFYRGADFWFTTWRDYGFICDGYNFPWVTSGDTAVAENHSLHIPAPGEFYVEILDDTASQLDGKYRWALLTWSNCDTTSVLCNGLTDTTLARCFSRHVGYISPEVTVHHRKVAIHFYWPQIADSGCASPLPLKAILCRTKADRTRLTVTPRASHMDTTWWQYSPDSLWQLKADTIRPDGAYYTTLIVDDGTGALSDGFPIVHEYDYGASDRRHLDSIIQNGMPRFFESVKCFDTFTDDTLHDFKYNAFERYYGDTSVNPSSQFYAKMYYAMTLLDTVLGVESDTSKTLMVMLEKNDSIIKISLPRVPTGMTNCVRRVYRGMTWQSGVANAGTRARRERVQDTLTALRLLTTVTNSDTTLLDTFSRSGIDSTLANHPIFVGKMHFRFKGTLYWKDRLYGWLGPNLYYSQKDTAKFGILDYISFSADDGAEITVVVGDRDRLLVYKNDSRHEIYEDASGDYTKSSPPYVVSGVGCIAPRSMQSWRGERIYLSRFGVVYETGNQYLDKGNQIDTISGGIQPLLDGWTYEERAGAVGFIFDDDKYLLSVPGHDTTFVCFLDQPGHPWAIYAPFSFNTATLYEDDSDYVLLPPDDIIFGKAGKDVVYKWGDSLTDNGVAYSATYQTGRILLAPEQSSIEKALMVREAGGATVTVYDIDGNSLGSYIIPDTGSALQLLGPVVANEVPGYQIKIVADTLTDSLRVQVLDLWYRLLKKGWE